MDGFFFPPKIFEINIFQTFQKTSAKNTPLEYGHKSNLKEIENMNNQKPEMKDQEFMVQKIRSQYLEKGHTRLDALKELDAKVKRPANVFAYVYGSISAIVMGAGMSLVMTDIGAILGMTQVMVPGIVIGVVGMAMALSTYPIYKKMLDSRRKHYGPAILELSEKLMTTFSV
jgi:hypothetical protein